MITFPQRWNNGRKSNMSRIRLAITWRQEGCFSFVFEEGLFRGTTCSFVTLQRLELDGLGGAMAHICLINESQLTYFRHDRHRYASTRSRIQQTSARSRRLLESWRRLHAAKQMPRQNKWILSTTKKKITAWNSLRNKMPVWKQFKWLQHLMGRILIVWDQKDMPKWRRIIHSNQL